MGGRGPVDVSFLSNNLFHRWNPETGTQVENVRFIIKSKNFYISDISVLLRCIDILVAIILSSSVKPNRDKSRNVISVENIFLLPIERIVGYWILETGENESVENED